MGSNYVLWGMSELCQMGGLELLNTPKVPQVIYNHETSFQIVKNHNILFYKLWKQSLYLRIKHTLDYVP